MDIPFEGKRTRFYAYDNSALPSPLYIEGHSPSNWAETQLLRSILH